MHSSFGLLLFSVDHIVIDAAMKAGAAAVVVDLENVGKSDRQVGANTQINDQSIDDVKRVRALTGGHLICRTNGRGPDTPQEIEQVLAAGADELLLPMVRSCADVEEVLKLVKNRCSLGVMLETRESLKIARDLSQLPVQRVYVGLNDLALELGNPSIFDAVVDGTVDRLRELFTVPFGFGGLTLPELGNPIPCRLLMGEMARLNCQFSVLRRSFLDDVSGADMGAAVTRVLSAMQEQFERGAAEVAEDHAQFVAIMRSSAPRLRSSS